MGIDMVCRRMRQAVPSLVAAIMLVSVCGESAAADMTGASISNDTIRIMLLGDSITHGSHSSTGNGYRAPLWNALTNLGYRVDFVGTQTDSYGRFDPTLGDPDHEGISGITIAGTLRRIDGVFDKCGEVDCVLMLLGTNESLMGERVFRNEATNSLVRLLDRIYARSPSESSLLRLCRAGQSRKSATLPPTGNMPPLPMCSTLPFRASSQGNVPRGNMRMCLTCMPPSDSISLPMKSTRTTLDMPAWPSSG